MPKKKIQSLKTVPNEAMKSYYAKQVANHTLEELEREFAIWKSYLEAVGLIGLPHCVQSVRDFDKYVIEGKKSLEVKNEKHIKDSPAKNSKKKPF